MILNVMSFMILRQRKRLFVEEVTENNEVLAYKI
jgi:hypothetical protein